MSLMLDIIAGQISPLYKELLDDGLINGTFSTEFFNGHNYAACLFSGESVNPAEVARKINSCIKELKEKGITEEQFETVRKKTYGKTVRAFTDIDTVANGLVVSHFDKDDLFSEFKVLQEITAEYCYELLKNSFNKDLAVLSVVMPKEI